MSAGVHDLRGTFHENVAYLVTDDANACLVLLCCLAGIWSKFSRDFCSGEGFCNSVL